MIPAIEMRVLDRNAVHFGVSILELMENAGKAVADVARKAFRVAGKRVLIVCGTGNHGGAGGGWARRESRSWGWTFGVDSGRPRRSSRPRPPRSTRRKRG